MQDTGAAAQQRRAMLFAGQALAGRFYADQPYALVFDEIAEEADGVGAAANTGDNGIGQTPELLEDLGARLAPDHPLELADHQWEGVGTCSRAQEIMRVFEARRPVAQRLVDRVLERPPAAFDRDDGGAHQLHAEDVELLPLDIFRAHIDDRFETEQRADNGSGDAVLPGAGFGDQAALAHALRQQTLRQHLVGLVRAAVKQVLPL